MIGRILGIAFSSALTIYGFKSLFFPVSAIDTVYGYTAPVVGILLLVVSIRGFIIEKNK
jgi:hypothetical protein